MDNFSLGQPDASNGNGTNESGFRGIPSGGRMDGAVFGFLDLYGMFWSTSPKLDSNKPNQAWYCGLHYFSHIANVSSIKKSLGFSARCVKGKQKKQQNLMIHCTAKRSL